MADNYGFQTGADKTARSRQQGSIDIPMIEVGSSIPTIVSFANQSVTTALKLEGAESAVSSGATHALVTVDPGENNLRYREDGTNPTTTIGLVVLAGEAVELTNLNNIRVIATASTIKLNISYRRYDQ